jgi:MFS family permease
MPVRCRTAIVVFTIFAATFANNALSPIYVIYELRFGLSSLLVTSLFATYALAVLVALVCIGRVSDDVGRRPLLLAGSVLLVVSTVIFLTAAGAPSLFIGRAVLGLATGTLSSAGSAALVELEPRHDHQFASLLTTLAFLAGAAIGPLTFGVVAEFLPDPTVTPFLVELGLQLLAFGGILALGEPAIHELGRLRWRIARPAVPVEIRRQFAVAGAVVTTGWMISGFYAVLSGSMDR